MANLKLSVWSKKLLHWDLGIRRLQPQWREVFASKGLVADFRAALQVSALALPVSLAIGLASDVPAEVGLQTAIVAGLIGAWFGGSRLAVSGPAAALVVLVGQTVDRYGPSGLMFVGFVAGVMQLIFGVFGAGRYLRSVPTSVFLGFRAGVALTVLVGQLPRALGLPAPDESHAISVLGHIGETLSQTHPVAVAMSLSVVVVALTVGRKWPAVPWALLLVGAFTAVSWSLSLPDSDLPHVAHSNVAWMPTIPSTSGDVFTLIGLGMLMFFVSSFESLHTLSELERQKPDNDAQDPDQELIGLGLANLAGSSLGGIPVASLWVRSKLNVTAGAQTRRASVLQALILAAVFFTALPLIEMIPIAVISSIFILASVQSVRISAIRSLWKVSKSDAVILFTTAGVMVLVNVFAGVIVGLFIAVVVALARLASTHFDLRESEDPTSAHQLTIMGALTFVSAGRIDALRDLIDREPVHGGLVLDMRHVDSIDVTAAEHLLELVSSFKRRGGVTAWLGASSSVGDLLLSLDPSESHKKAFAFSDKDVDRILGNRRSVAVRTRLLAGLERFRSQVRGELSPLLAELAAGQSPHTLFLTCSDSRVAPKLLTGAQPGELFVIRNIGALLPPYMHKTLNDEGAALEYAIEVLGVRNLIICGHSRCGAMTALKTKKMPDNLPALKNWADGAASIVGDLDSFATVDEATRAAIVRQTEHLKSYPVVSSRLEDITISAWFYDFENADVLEFDPSTGGFVTIGSKRISLSLPPPEMVTSP